MISFSPTPAVAEGCCEQRDRPLVHPSLVHSAQLLGLQPRLLGDVLQEAQGHEEAGILLILPVARVLACKGWQETVFARSYSLQQVARVSTAKGVVNSGRLMLQILPAGQSKGPDMLHLSHKGAASPLKHLLNHP